MVEHLLGIYKVLGSVSGTERKGLNALVTFSPLTEAEMELGIRSEQKKATFFSNTWKHPVIEPTKIITTKL